MKFRHPSDGEIRRLLLADAIADIHARSRGTYGMLRIRAALEIEQGLIVNKKLVWKIMRELGLKGLPGPNTGVRNLKNVATCEDLVQRSFVATRPNELWLTDITEHPSAEGKVCCCVVLDLFSRKVVGWAIDRRCESALVIDAVNKANGSRPERSSTVIHSDHGSQYTSWAFRERAAPGSHQLDGHRRRLLRQRPHGVVLGLRCKSSSSIDNVGAQTCSSPSALPTTSRTSTTWPGATAP